MGIQCTQSLFPPSSPPPPPPPSSSSSSSSSVSLINLLTLINAPPLPSPFPPEREKSLQFSKYLTLSHFTILIMRLT